METILLFRKPVLLLSFCLLSYLGFPQVTEQWVKRFEGVLYDGRPSLAVDAIGDIYVTGNSDSNYATIKYNANGDELWVKRYNGPGNSYDVASALAIDHSGNVYVTGNSVGSGGKREYATIKYDTNGKELWVKRYNGSGYLNNGATSLTVDGSGNVYVTGFSQRDKTGNYDYATIKYDTNGKELWIKRYKATIEFYFYPASLAVDNNGNVYVIGTTVGSGSGFNNDNHDYDYVTVKYASNGEELWVRKYNGTGNYIDQATAIAIDNDGNIYVTGGSVDSISWGYATIKYNTEGKELWVKRYRKGGGVTYASSVVVDSFNNAYVTGTSYGRIGYDYATIKYDANGKELWVRRYNGPARHFDDEANSLAVDAFGNVYVTGYSRGISGTWDDYATIKYDANGRKVWLKRYNGAQNSADRASSIAVDRAGNVYVTGESYGDNTGVDYTTIKYSQTQNNPPTVSLSIPYNIVKYSAPARIKLNAKATDKDGTITKVQFFNGDTKIHTETESPYGFLWIVVPVGSYTLTAKAFDNSGNVTTSNSIKVSVVEENVPPVVSIESPVDDTTYTGPATIRLIAKAKDPNDRISKVEFYNGTALLRTEHYYPYTYWWHNVKAGTYTITAKAYDDKGLSATSKPVEIKVTNASIVSRPSSANSKTDLNDGLSVRINPNPARSTLQIYTKGLQVNRPSTISVLSSAGVLMKTIQLNNLNKVVQLDVSTLVSGVYTIKVMSGDNVLNKQFVKL